MTEENSPRAGSGTPIDREATIVAEHRPSPSGPGPGFDLAWAMVEASPDALMMTDEAGTITVVNRQAEVLFGYDRDELLGLPVEVLVPDDRVAAHRAHRTRYRDEPHARVMGCGLELWGQRSDGSTFPVEIGLSPLMVDGERRVIAAVRDISERLAGEEQARLVQQTIDSIADAVFMCDEETLEFTYVNQGAIDMHGYSRDELLGGMGPADLAPTVEPTEIAAALAGLADAPDASARLRTEGRRRDGTTLPVEVDINWPAGAQRDGPRPVMAVVRDISAQVAGERAVRDSEARFHAAFDEGPVPMMIVEVSPPEERTMVDVNQALADLYGYDRDQLIGRPATDLVHPDDVHPDASFASAVAAGQDVDYEPLVRGIRADGSEIWLQRYVSALDPGGAQDKLVVHVVDVTAQVEADLVRRRQEALTAALSSLRLEMLRGASRSQGLTMLCKTASELLEAHGAVILIPLEADEEALAIEAAVGVPRSVQAQMSFRTTEGAVGEIFRTGEPRHLNSGRHPTTPEVNRRVLDEQQVGPVLLAPLPGEQGVAGVLIVIRLADREPFTDVDLDPARQLAAGAVSAIELAQARSNEASLQLLEDRDRIGRDMHDNVIGRLFGTGMGLQASLNLVSDPTATAERIATAVDEIDHAIRDIRTAIYGVRSRIDWGKGVRGAVLAIVAEAADTLGFEPGVTLDGPIDELPEPVVEDLLAVIREALTNAAKYAAATTVRLAVTCGPESLTAEVFDDGRGFTSASADDDFTGNGLRNMTARATSHGGTTEVSSRPGEGTTIVWTVPLGR